MTKRQLSVKNSGFSLIEMLIVIVVFAILAYFITQSTLSTFVGSRKSDAQGKVRDNLNFAASVVERNVRNAKSVASCTASMQTLSYKNELDQTKTFSCSGSFLDWDGSHLTSSDVYITACSFSCTQSNVTNPPIIDLQLVGRENVSTTAEQSLTAITRRIVLRVY